MEERRPGSSGHSAGDTRTLRIVEFLAIGIVMGIAEDLIAVSLASDAEITWRVIWIVFFVALPFAFFSEMIVDHPRFWENLFRWRKRGKGRAEETSPNTPSSL